jgi:hypothetical protein
MRCGKGRQPTPGSSVIVAFVTLFLSAVIAGAGVFDFDLNDLIEVGKKAGLKNSKVIVEQTISVISQWEKYAKNAGIAIKQAKALRKAHRLKIE